MAGLGSLVMSANHIAAQAGRFEPQRTNNGVIVIYGLGAFGGSTEGGVSIVTLALAQFPTPKDHTDPVMVGFMNQDRKVAGNQQFDEFQMGLIDYVDVPVAATLLNWRAAVRDAQTGQIGLAKNYKKTAEVQLYGPDGQTVRKYKLEGVWPSQFDHGDIDMTSPDPLRIEATLQVDKCYPITSNWGAGLTRPLGNGGGVLGQVVDGAADVLQGAANSAITDALGRFGL